MLLIRFKQTPWQVYIYLSHEHICWVSSVVIFPSAQKKKTPQQNKKKKLHKWKIKGWRKDGVGENGVCVLPLKTANWKKQAYALVKQN